MLTASVNNRVCPPCCTKSDSHFNISKYSFCAFIRVIFFVHMKPSKNGYFMVRRTIRGGGGGGMVWPKPKKISFEGCPYANMNRFGHWYFITNILYCEFYQNSGTIFIFRPCAMIVTSDITKNQDPLYSIKCITMCDPISIDVKSHLCKFKRNWPL